MPIDLSATSGASGDTRSLDLAPWDDNHGEPTIDDDYDDYGDYGDYGDDVAEVIVSWLRDGPVPASTVIDRLLDGGHIPGTVLDRARAALAADGQDTIDQLDRGELHSFLLEDLQDGVLAGQPDIWVTRPGLRRRMGLVSQMFNGTVFTHLLTPREHRNGQVAVWPDLVGLRDAADIGKGAPLSGGGTVREILPWGLRVPGHDTSALVGDDGWLDGFSPGDLLAFRVYDGVVSVSLLDEWPEVNGSLECSIGEAARALLDGTDGVETDPVLAEVLTRNPDAFRKPEERLSELFACAELENEGFAWYDVRDDEDDVRDEDGEAADDIPAREAADQRRDMRRLARERMAVERFKLDRCCLTAFRRAMAQVGMITLDPAFGKEDKGPFTLAKFMDDMAHGAVARAVAHDVVTAPLTGDEPATEEFAHSLAEGDRPPGLPSERELVADPRSGYGERPDLSLLPEPNRVTALEQLLGRAVEAADGAALCAVLMASALVAVKRGDPVAAEGLLRDAQRADPGDDGPERELVRFELDRGNVAVAASLVRRVGSTLQEAADEQILAVDERLSSRYKGVGRNNRCPCGSGRKYKACCLTDPVPLPAREQSDLLFLKLLVHATETRVHELRLLTMVCQGRLASVEIVDLLVHDPTFVQGYLNERGALLPAREREWLKALIDEPRRVWRLEDADARGFVRATSEAVGSADPVGERIVEVEGSDLPDGIGRALADGGGTVFGRIIPAEEGRGRFIGRAVPVPAEAVDSAVALLAADGPGPFDLAQWANEHLPEREETLDG